jgi:hypothetical protein
MEGFVAEFEKVAGARPRNAGFLIIAFLMFVFQISCEKFDHIDISTSFVRMSSGARLNYVDVLVCTVPYLCLLLEPVDLPTLGYFGHPLLPLGGKEMQGDWIE